MKRIALYAAVFYGAMLMAGAGCASLEPALRVADHTIAALGDNPLVAQAVEQGLQDLLAQAAVQGINPEFEVEIAGSQETRFAGTVTVRLRGVAGQLMTSASLMPPTSQPVTP